jgi:hypothetical protein
MMGEEQLGKTASENPADGSVERITVIIDGLIARLVALVGYAGYRLQPSPISPPPHPPMAPSPHPSTYSLTSLLRFPLLLTLCFSLLGCSIFNPWPPSGIVEQAIAQKLDQTQSLLSTQISGLEVASDSFRVGRVKINSRRSMSIEGQPVVEVSGTYTLKGRSLSRSQIRQARPFDIFLQRGETNEQWQLVDQ